MPESNCCSAMAAIFMGHGILGTPKPAYPAKGIARLSSIKRRKRTVRTDRLEPKCGALFLTHVRIHRNLLYSSPPKVTFASQASDQTERSLSADPQ